MDCKTPIIIASELGHIDIVKILVENNAKISWMDAFNRNSVYYAASNGHYDILKVLLETDGGKKMTAEYDRDYFYPLHKAAENGHIGVVKLLMENKASAICTTDLHYRPIHLAGMLVIYSTIIKIRNKEIKKLHMNYKGITTLKIEV